MLVKAKPFLSMDCRAPFILRKTLLLMADIQNGSGQIKNETTEGKISLPTTT